MLRKLFPFLILLVIFASCKKDTTDYGPIDKAIIENYLASHSLTAQSTASGLYYIVGQAGGVNHPNLNSYVSVNYKGFLTNGTVFDQSYSNGQPTTFALNSVIAGWKEGLQLIGIHGKITLLIPSALGYGSTAKTGIPSNSVLLFDVELVEFY